MPQKTIAGSKLVVVRVLGGESYWPYGLEKLHVTAVANGVRLAVLPGDDRPDPGLDRFSTVGPQDRALLHAYLNEGGPQNAANFLRYCAFLTGKGEAPPEPAPLLKAGLWYPGLGICGAEAVARKFRAWTHRWRQSVSTGRWCSRAALQPIEAMVAALAKAGLNALPVFVSSLKDAVSVETVRAVFSRHRPDVVLNTTGFAVGSLTGAHEGTVLDENGAMVLQVILSGGTREAWEASSQGLATRDLAMNVALPEVDGRVLSRAVAFKHAGAYDERVQATIVSHRADDERCEFVARLAANWARLGARRSPAIAASRWCWQITPTATVALRTASASTRRPARSRC